MSEQPKPTKRQLLAALVEALETLDWAKSQASGKVPLYACQDLTASDAHGMKALRAQYGESITLRDLRNKLDASDKREERTR